MKGQSSTRRGDIILDRCTCGWSRKQQKWITNGCNKHQSIMPEFKKVNVGGVDLVVKERMDARNRHGALEYIVEAYLGGELVHSERIHQSAWLGHCDGQLLLPEIAARVQELRDRTTHRKEKP